MKTKDRFCRSAGLAFAAAALLITACSPVCEDSGTSFSNLSGAYLGQNPPGMRPELFAPQIVSTGYRERGPAFTPDGREMFYTLYGAPFGVFLRTKEVDGFWTEPRVATFSGRYPGEMSISPDGNTVVFSSNQPFESSPDTDEYWVWRVEREETGWGEPKPLGPEVNSGKYAGYPYLSNSGNLYFFSEREDSIGNADIYVAEWTGGKYGEPRNLGGSINTELEEVDPAVSPDESYMIFARKDENGVVNLFISFRNEDQSWSEAKDMGEAVNSEATEFCPFISADGKYIFFTSTRRIVFASSDAPITYEEKLKILNGPGNGNSDIYWVDARIIEDYRDGSAVFSGPYLGQSPPGNEPQLFMPGLVSTNYIDHCIGFLREGSVCVFSIWEKGTYSMYEKNGRWTRPERVPWQNERGATDFTIGPDGNTLYFQSGRPTSPDDKERETNIWKVEWTGDGWTDPVPLPSPANTEEFSELYPSVAQDGTIYYFTGSRSDSDIGDIYRSRLVDGRYREAERVPDPVNSDYYEVDPVVAPDGSYLLFGSGRPGGYSQLDLYISFRGEDGSWTAPVNAGPGLNPFGIPTRMSVTPDGRYFFFPSRHETEVPKGKEITSPSTERWGDYDVYWIGTGFIEDLRDQYIGKSSAAEMIASEYRERGILPAAAMLNELYGSKRDRFYFELSEFMVFLGDLMTAGKSEDADRLYEALLKSIPEEFRVKQGYAITCLLNGQASKGLDLIKETWTQFPSAKSEDMFIVTFQLRRRSSREDELAVLRFIALEFADSAFAHLNLAAAHEHYGETEKAIESCTKALDLNPAFEDALEMRRRLASKLETPQGPVDD